MSEPRPAGTNLTLPGPLFQRLQDTAARLGVPWELVAALTLKLANANMSGGN